MAEPVYEIGVIAPVYEAFPVPTAPVPDAMDAVAAVAVPLEYGTVSVSTAQLSHIVAVLSPVSTVLAAVAVGTAEPLMYRVPERRVPVSSAQTGHNFVTVTVPPDMSVGTAVKLPSPHAVAVTTAARVIVTMLAVEDGQLEE